MELHCRKSTWWGGGIWERLIQSVKKCLRTVIGRETFEFEQLQTLLAETESVINARPLLINSRPLTYLHDDTEGVSYTLSPSHFMYGQRIPKWRSF